MRSGQIYRISSVFSICTTEAINNEWGISHNGVGREELKTVTIDPPPPPRLFIFNSSAPSLCLLYPVTHLDCARDLYGSSSPDNEHRAHSTLRQGLQRWLGDVGRLQRNIFLICSLSCAKIIP